MNDFMALDLSAAGMRVVNAVGLRSGERLRLALHSPASDAALVLESRVLCCDERGEAALAFEAPGARERACLDQLLAGPAGGGPPVVAEIL